MSYLLRRRQLYFALILKGEQSHVLFALGEAAPSTFGSQKKSVPLGLLQNTKWEAEQEVDGSILLSAILSLSSQ